MLWLIGAFLRPAAAQSPAEVLPAVSEIIAEATLPPGSPAGKPLPLASHWNLGLLAGGFSPQYQLDRIAAGDHILLSFAIPTPWSSQPDLAYFEASIRRAAQLKLPIALVGTQWETILYMPQYPYLSLPAAQNPNVIKLDGSVQAPLLDPMGPVAPWRDVGQIWASQPLLGQLQTLYPDPPLVIFVSNDEAVKIPWKSLESSKRYVDAYGLGRGGDFMNGVAADGWIERYRALISSFRNNLVNENWRKRAIFVGYSGLAHRKHGSWGGWFWMDGILVYPTPQFVTPQPLWFDGGLPPGYLFDWDSGDTDYTINGPQSEAENWVASLSDTFRLKPTYWHGFSIWDGGPTKRTALSGVGPFTPPRYAAMAQSIMWLLRPREVREYRGWNDTVSNAGIWFDAIVEAVNSFYRNPDLKRFWRSGQLVPNRSRTHPYNQTLFQLANEDRWHILNTTLDPPSPYDQNTQLRVFAYALVLGQAPNREWLLYVQAPMGDQSNVGISIPDYAQVFVSAPVRGAYYLVREGQGAPQMVDTNPAVPLTVSPSSGSGARQLFTVNVRDLSGASDISWVQLLVTGTQFSTNACYIHYTVANNSFFLYNDSAQGGQGIPAGSGIAENTQCYLYGAGSTGSVAGTDLTITLDVSFKRGFVGSKNVYAQAVDRAGNVVLWKKLGTWTVVDDAPAMVSFSPAVGTGSSQTFTAVMRDSNGGNNLAWVQFLVTAAGASYACYVHYQVMTNTLFLFDETTQYGSWIGGGTTAVAQNNQCVLRGTGSGGTVSGTDLTVSFNLTFRSVFAGNKNLYIVARDLDGNIVPGTQVGTWTAVGDPALPGIVSITPSAGTGSSQTFTAVLRDPNGGANLGWAQLLVTGGGATNACYIHYAASDNTFYLFDDSIAGGSWIPAGSGTAENSQCVLRGAGSGGTVSGTDLTVTFNLAFKPTFSGTKKLYLVVRDRDGNVVPAAQMGTWTVP